MLFAGSPETLDPQRHQEDLTRMVLANFYEGLVELDGNLRPRAALAVEWSSPTENVWRFRLRPGVTFHDGQPFGPEDVKRTIERARSLRESKVEADVRAITTVRIVDGSTVELVTDRPRPLLLGRLAMTPILPRSAPDAEIVSPVGTGPYRFSKGSAKEPVEGVRFERYWGPRPWSPGFRIDMEPQDEARLARARDFDVSCPLPERASSDTLEIVRHPTVTVSFLVCRLTPLADGSASPFRDARVRRAVSLAIDRDQLAKGNDARAARQLALRGVVGFVPELEQGTSVDRERARALLREAGYPDGLRTTLCLSSRGASMGAELARQLATVGIALEVAPVAWPELYRRMSTGEAPLAVASWTLSGGDPSSLFEQVAHSRTADGAFGAENTSGYASAEMDAEIEAASLDMVNVSRSRRLESIMRRAMTDLPLVPLSTPLWSYGIRKGLLFTPRLDLAVRAADIRRIE